MIKQDGFTLIEVLISMVILAIGLLGAASLQVRSLQDTGNSGLRSVAIYLANDMADRIRANSAGTGAATNYNSIAGAALTGNCLTVAGCSVAAMANHDKQEWLTNLSQSLPEGLGTLSRDGDIFSIEITWTERVKQDGASFDTGSVTLTFEP
mgnify:CR=1 FL=1